MSEQSSAAGRDPVRGDAEVGKPLGFPDVASVVVAGIIGVGVFFTPARVAMRAADGGFALLAWVAGAVMAVIGGLTFAELGCSMPAVGGQFVVLTKAFGRRTGFVYVCSVMTFVVAAALAILAIICAEYLAESVGVSLEGQRSTFAALGILFAVYLVNIAGVKVSAGFLRLNAVIKVVIIFGIIGLGFFARRTPVAPTAFSFARSPGLGGFCYATVPVLFSYGGWEQALWTCGEVRNPGRNVVRGIVVGVAIVVLAYLGLNAALLMLLGAPGVAQDALVTSRAVAAVAPGLAHWVSVAVGISALGTTHAIMLSGPRQIAAMAREGLAPAPLGRFSARTGTPVAATTTLFVAAMTLAVVGGKDGVDRLLDALGCVNWFFFALTGLAVIVLRRRFPDLPRPYRVPGYPLTPLVFAALALVAAASPFFEAGGRVPAAWAAGGVLTLGLIARLFIKNQAPAHPHP